MGISFVYKINYSYFLYILLLFNSLYYIIMLSRVSIRVLIRTWSFICPMVVDTVDFLLTAPRECSYL